MSRSCGRKRENCCGCDFSNILLLILIALQFGGRDGIFGSREICSGEEHHREHGLIDNSILFILAFYYLVCCRQC